MIRNVLLLFFCICEQFCLSQEGQPFITNYTEQEYKASISNWGITQANSGLLLFANHDGLLCYDGSQWHNLISENALLSLALDSCSNKIIYGGVKSYGYLQINQKGQLTYKSFLPDKTLDSLVAVRDILISDDATYFFTNKGVKSWKNNELQNVEDENTLFYPRFHKLDSKVYAPSDKGIMVLGNEILHTAYKPQASIKRVIFSAKIDSTHLFISPDMKAHVFNRDKYEIIPFLTHENPSFRLSDGQNIPNKDGFIFSSYQGGIYITDKKLNFKYQLNEYNGLISSQIKEIRFDKQQNLWVASQNGLSHVELSSPWRNWSKNSGLRGSPWAISKTDSSIFLGTSDGVFKLSQGLKRIPNLHTKVWALDRTSLGLIAATNNGLFLINEEDNFKVKSSNKAGSMIKKIDLINESLIYTGLECISLLSKEGEKFTEKVLLRSKGNTYHDIEQESSGVIWVTAKAKGVYRISSIHSKTPTVKLYNENNGLEGGLQQPSLLSVKGEIWVGTSQGFYVYDEKNDSFKPRKDIAGNVMREAKVNDSTFYVTFKTEDNLAQIEKITFGKNDITRISRPYKRLRTSEVLDIYPEPNGHIWFATPDGLFRFDENVEKDYDIPYNTLVRKVFTSDSVIFYGSYFDMKDGEKIIVDYQPDHFKPSLEHEKNNISFEFSATSYELPKENQFQHFLEGYDQSWSAWSKETKKEYSNLDAGEYTFMVKSKNIYDTEGKLAKYSFTILAPWYQTFWAKALFLFIGVAFIWLISLLYTYRVRMQRRKLKLIVADRTFEVLSQKKEIEERNALLRTKNQEIIAQSEHIRDKNQELKSSREEVLNINKQLQDLNSLLEKKVAERTSQIEMAMTKLQSKNNELDTFVYRASHDLKGPVSRIHGLTSLAKLEKPDDSNLKYYDMIEAASKEMELLLSKLTQVHEVYNHPVSAENLDIILLLDEIQKYVAYLKLEAKYTVEIDDNVRLNTDKRFLLVVLTNIMENALIFRKFKGDKHEILLRVDHDDKSTNIEIRDNGVGMDQDNLDNIYEMFYRGSQQSKGSGLGLYLAKIAADKLGVKISVLSEPGKYTSFVVSIPSYSGD